MGGAEISQAVQTTRRGVGGPGWGTTAVHDERGDLARAGASPRLDRSSRCATPHT
jgi:hypothetical protein